MRTMTTMFLLLIVSSASNAQPWLTIPEPNATVLPRRVPFQWATYLGPFYGLQIAWDSSFSVILMEDDSLESPSVIVSQLPDSATLYWRANYSSGATRIWSTFRILHTLPPGSPLCPFEIGNKWYYKAHSGSDSTLSGMIKEIVDSTRSGYRVVNVTKIHRDRKRAFSKEYWLDRYGQLFTMTDTLYLGYAVYDCRILKDTLISLSTWDWCSYVLLSFCTAFQRAVRRYPLRFPLIMHSDRGSQYTSAMYRELLSNQSVLVFQSNGLSCYDNAIAESFFNTLKTEGVDHEQFPMRAEAHGYLFDYIEVFYNQQRLHSSLGYNTPMQMLQEIINTKAA